MKAELLSRLDWSYESAFRTIDLRGEGFLSSDSIKLFLRINGYTATQQEIDAIIRRVDTNSDYLITLAEFIDLFKLKPIVAD
jgi:Ca2+-binding EF-hand superfamily protein